MTRRLFSMAPLSCWIFPQGADVAGGMTRQHREIIGVFQARGLHRWRMGATDHRRRICVWPLARLLHGPRIPLELRALGPTRKTCVGQGIATQTLRLCKRQAKPAGQRFQALGRAEALARALHYPLPCPTPRQTSSPAALRHT